MEKIPKKRESLIIRDYNAFQDIIEKEVINEIIYPDENPKKRESIIIGDYNGFQDVIEEEITIEKEQEIKVNIIDKVFENINEIFEDVKNTKNNYNDIKKKLNILKKDYLRIVNQKKKNNEKNASRKNKLQCGFVKPRAISDEMCDFLNIDRKSYKGRNEITTEINRYIVDNDLRDIDDRRIILPNDKLKKLLHIEKDYNLVLSYFNIQSYLKIHFI